MKLLDGQWKLIESVSLACLDTFHSLVAPGSRLNVRNYERLAMLAYIMQSVFIDPKWVAEEYLRRCKAGKWKKGSAEDSLKCYNFERIVDAEIFGLEAPTQITLDEYMWVL